MIKKRYEMPDFVFLQTFLNEMGIQKFKKVIPIEKIHYTTNDLSELLYRNNWRMILEFPSVEVSSTISMITFNSIIEDKRILCLKERPKYELVKIYQWLGISLDKRLRQEDIINFDLVIRDAIESQGLSIREFAQLHDLNLGNLKQLLSFYRNPRIKTLYPLWKMLDIHLFLQEKE